MYNSTTTSATDPASATVNMEWLDSLFVDTHDTIPKPDKAKVGTIVDVENVVKLDLVDNDTDDDDERYVLVDMVSNLAGGGWTVVTDAGTYGQSGLIPAAGSTAVPINLVSMYRKINYDNVTKDHKKDTAAKTVHGTDSWRYSRWRWLRWLGKIEESLRSKPCRFTRCAALQRCCHSTKSE